MAEAEECRLDSDEDDDDVSVHSAISNASDFGEDEEVDYLALELVQHLPPEKVTRLCKNMRTKEKAVQDLLHRNKSLLDSCQKLDKENAALQDRLSNMEKSEAPAASANVDSSVFLKMERSKEEQILTLKYENDRLKHQVVRMNDHGQQMEEALVQARKELKRLQQGKVKAAPAREPEHHPVLDEEERLYRELQSDSAVDLIMRKLQEKQAESRDKVQAALRALIHEDGQRIERWSSDVAAVMLTIESLEGKLKQVPDSVSVEFRQVRSMGKALSENLDMGRKAANERMEQVIGALHGEVEEKKPSTAAPQEAKRKKANARKKGRAGNEEGRKEPEPNPNGPREEAEVDPQLRAELHEALGISKAPACGSDAEDRSSVLTGPELLKELQSLRNDAEALEARMSERLRARGESFGEEEPLAAAAKPKVQRKKKMYA